MIISLVAFGLSLLFIPDLVSGQFAYDLYEKTLSDNDDNIIISPLSVHSCLSLAYIGAAGQTALEMANVLKFPSISKADVSDSYHSLIEDLSNSSSLRIANKIFVRAEYDLKPAFLDIARRKFYSSARRLNFSNSEESAHIVNHWVAKQTHNKIRSLVEPSLITRDSRAIIANAIYFKGFWTYRFDTEETRKFPFWVGGDDKEIVQVDMMHVKAKYKYGVFDALDAVACELTCKNSHISMLILLPKKRNGLHKIESNLKNINFGELSNEMIAQELVVFLPKFKIEFSINLNKALKKMGLHSMFDQKANFTDLVDSDEPLYISDVVHKAFIEVNEEGAEAAGATTALFMKRVMPLYPYFVAEHPFLFVLKDVNTHEIIFIGRFKRPVAD